MKIFSSKTSRATILSLLTMVLPVAAFSHGDDLRHIFNDVANAGTPLENRAVNTHKDADGQYSAVIAGSYISRTGSVPIHAVFSPGNIFPGNLDIDWGKDDAFVHAFNGMQQEAETEIAARPDLQALIRKPDWTAEDRRQWDSAVADIVAAIVHRTPGLDAYRTETGDHPVPRTRHLNDISQDMIDGTHKKEFDCEAMSIVKIVLLQRMADEFLSQDQASSYFYVSGMVEFGIYDDTPGGHAFIVTEKNGMVTGVVEGTDDNFAFRDLQQSMTFADFVNGREIVTTDGSVYGSEFTHQQANQDRTAAGIKTYDTIMQELRQRRQQQEVPRTLWLQM